MSTLFDPAHRQTILGRISALAPEARRQWGKMNVSQMLAHCSAALRVATGDTPRKQALIGKVFAPFVKSKLLGDQPFSKNSPTDPTFIITDEREFEAEKERLAVLISRFCDAGPEKAGHQIHSFLGRLRGEDWGRMMYKHLDHHLQQFGA